MSRRARRGLGVRILGWMIAGMLIAWSISMATVLWYSQRDTARRADAIVVLGAAQYVGRPSPVLRARLDHAIGLYKEGLAPRLVLTGGIGTGDTTSEAAVGRRYVMRRGVPDSAIVTENRGRTTRESIQAVAKWMHAHDDSTTILVSDPFHMLRLSVIARRHGLQPLTSPTRTSPISSSPTEWKYLVSESLKVPYILMFERSAAP